MGYFSLYFGVSGGSDEDSTDPLPPDGMPISELIALDLVNTLADITTVGGFYANTVSEVVRPAPGVGTKLKDLSIVVAQGIPVRQDNPPQGHSDWIHPFSIICCVMESGDTAIDTRLNTIRADVEKILRVDPHRGGLAINTEIADPDFEDTQINAITGTVTVNVNVKYRTLINDPYHQ